MDDIDLNLVTALDVLLSEASVTAAARRLGLSTSAMSRTLTRLRIATGDPLLVRAGRRLVPTPHAAALRDRVHAVASDARAVLRPATADVDLATLTATFTIRAAASFMEMLSGPVVAALADVAPHVRIRFVPKLDRDPQALRDGTVDLEIGKRGDDAPELHTRMLFHDWHVAVARAGHPVFASARITPARYAACRHVMAAQLGDFSGPADDTTGNAGPGPAVHVVVPGYPDAMRVAASTDLIALVPRSSLGNACSPGLTEVLGLRSFEIPVRLPAILVSALWHPRMHGDPVHRRLRDTVIAVCQRAYPDSRPPRTTARGNGARVAG
ncbi:MULTISPECIES: LysR family transcriptional regulator [Burkholderia cepacia complex]|uniref:LysR family transcriptional regulator n=1 Tax=Burkholderia cepacia complex TaxID=87882 RepID=UPI00075F43EB|nr:MULTISPECIES: LysR family transcriptional regulator [Burkholderia cepacia complex]KVH04349.1 LysR family transcriptional regulator [Burkholderia anthina]KVH06768.1 LysR family transcriptional regulator [Burkholderia anthina]KVM96136.1 LysR family transcriptional regulator [Burkholderia anthina]KVX33334.1 LysR family transcriptional regulator [Burkholderia anthina]MDF3093747.1 LysR family transcriptional regulator [Burkholderia semiarida]